MLAKIPLHELRRARGLSPKMLAETLHVQQHSVANLERRTDMNISTLRSHIEAMGRELGVIANAQPNCFSGCDAHQTRPPQGQTVTHRPCLLPEPEFLTNDVYGYWVRVTTQTIQRQL